MDETRGAGMGADEEMVPLVELAREIEARPETVWRILTTPALFGEWMDGVVSFAPEPGSAFRAEFAQFQTVVAGEVVAVDPEAMRFSVTWGVESGAQAESFPAGCTMVEFSVRPSMAGCTIEVRHSRFPSEDLAAQHGAGWRFHCSRLALKANRADLSEALERTVDGWFSAWNERNAERRAEILAGCCAEDVAFRDEWTDSSGRDLLSMHIGNFFIHIPEMSLERVGAIAICRGEAVVRWRGAGQGGHTLTGVNHMRVDHDGTIRRVTGFELEIG